MVSLPHWKLKWSSGPDFSMGEMKILLWTEILPPAERRARKHPPNLRERSGSKVSGRVRCLKGKSRVLYISPMLQSGAGTGRAGSGQSKARYAANRAGPQKTGPRVGLCQHYSKGGGWLEWFEECNVHDPSFLPKKLTLREPWLMRVWTQKNHSPHYWAVSCDGYVLHIIDLSR